jgi:hypothetical protein
MLNVTFKSIVLSVITLSVITLSVINAERQYAECHNAKCHYAECCGAHVLPTVLPLMATAVKLRGHSGKRKVDQMFWRHFFLPKKISSLSLNA